MTVMHSYIKYICDYTIFFPDGAIIIIYHYQKYCYRMCSIRSGSSRTAAEPYINSGSTYLQRF
jgi:hypothetical protein